MPFKKDETEETKNRIINVSEQLFSQKGFDATRIDEIAAAASINKAVIYYYFKSKEAILDHLIQAFFNTFSKLCMDFAHGQIVQMIKDGQLDIQPERWHFTNDEAIQSFLEHAYKFYETLIEYALEQRHVMRILVFESLKDSKHHADLFHVVDLINGGDHNPIYKMIWEADKDYTVIDDTIVFKFFFGFIPLISFAAYFDDYKKRTPLSEQELRISFLNSYRNMLSPFISGTDLLIWGTNTKD